MMQGPKQRNKLCPKELFRVSDAVRYLDAGQLHRFEESFAKWKNSAKRSDSVRARERLRLTFMLLRHTGARLGEVLELDDRSAFDPERSMVRVGRGASSREVPLPDAFCAEVVNMLESPMGCGLRGSFFQIDPGYLRRVCYARGKECGLPKELSNPRVLRNTRAVEMLRGGVPLSVVKDVLGQSSLDFAEGLQEFSRADVASIVRLAHEDMRKRTSARNSFLGHVSHVRTDAVMAEVVMQTQAGQEVCAIITMDSLRNLRLEPGSPVVATVKAPLVNVVASESPISGSARNRYTATILRVAESPVLSEVTGRLEDGTEMCALVSHQSMKDMKLKPGDAVQFWFKALSVVLNTMQP